MNAERFGKLLDAYGSEPRRWPPNERSAAEAFSVTVEGARLLASERALEAWLDAASPPQPSLALRQRVLAAAPQPRRGLAGGWGRLGLWAPGAGLAAAGLAGVLFGATLSGSGRDPEIGAELLLAEAGAFDEAVLPLEGPL